MNESIDYKTKKEIKWTGFIILSIVALLGLWTILDYESTSNYFSKERKYTITTSIRTGAYNKVSGFNYIYTFTVNSKNYSGITNSIKSIHKRYFVEFYPPDPSISRVTFVEADDIDIKNIPASGVDSLPHK